MKHFGQPLDTLISHEILGSASRFLGQKGTAKGLFPIMYEISNELEDFLSKLMTGNSEKTFPFL
jgi:hypothetical protein